MNVVQQTAIATGVAGYDVMSVNAYRTSSKSRTIKSIGYTGSAVVGDTSVEVFVGNVSAGIFRNSSLGVSPKVDTDLKKVYIRVPAGEVIRAIVQVVATTNPTCLEMAIDDAASFSGTRRNTIRRRSSYRRGRGV